MKITKTFENLIFALIIFLPLAHLSTSAFLPELSNKVVLLFLVFIFFFFLKFATKLKVLIGVVALVFYVVYNALNYGLYQITHSDFYTFVLLGLIFGVYTEKSVLTKFECYLKRREKMFFVTEILFFLVLAYSLIFQNGLRAGYGSRIPVLYGPYEVAHMLGYMLVAYYCLNAYYQRMTHKKAYFVCKVLCVVLGIWSAARSVVLAMALMVFADFIKIRSLKKKYILVGAVTIVGLYLLLFTGLLINNPLIQKTIAAANRGSITNGRELFTEIALEYYENCTSTTEKLCGIGMNNVRQIFLNSPKVGVAIHAHNEYVNMLVGYGLIGLILYVIAQISQMRALQDWKMKFILECFIFVLAYFNGFAMYCMFTPLLIVIYVFMNQKPFEKN